MRWIMIFCAVALMLTQTVSAQSLVPLSDGGTEETPVFSEPLTAAEAEALVSRLSDSDVRAILLDRLAAQAEQTAEGTDNGLADFFYHATQGAWTSVTMAIERLPVLFSAQARAFATYWDTFGAAGLLTFLTYFGIVLVAAAAAEFVFRRLTAKWHALPPRDTAEDRGLRTMLSSLFQRLCRDLLAVAVFIGVAGTVSNVIMPPEHGVYADLIGPWLIALPRMAWAVGRFFAAPDYPDYRILNLTDHAARAVVFHQVWIAVLIGFSFVIVQFNTLNGVPVGETRLGFWLNLAVHVYLAVVMWHYRDALVDMMRGREEVTPAEDRVARAFPYFAVGLSLGMWWVVNMLVSKSKAP